MLYEFKCQKYTCKRVFEEPMSLSRYEKVLAMDPPFYEVRCPMCDTKAPKRHYTAMSSPRVHRDYGEWNPRTAPKELVGRSWTSKGEKEQQVREVMGSNFVVGEVDRDKTVKPFNPQAVHIKAKDVKRPTGPIDVKSAVQKAIKPGVSFKVKNLAKEINAPYNRVYTIVKMLDGVTKVAPGEFQLSS